MKIIHEIINSGKGSYGAGEVQLTREELLRIYDETRSISSLILTTSGTSGAATYNSVAGVLNIPNYTQDAIDGFVPYTGATANLNLGDKQLIADAIQLSLLPVSPIAPGKLKWNPDAGTMDIGMGFADVVQQVGMETYYPPVKNQTGSTIANGTVVMATGTLGASGRILITPAVANGSVPSRFMLGITTHDIPNGGDGVVTWFGMVRGFNTVTKAPSGETWVDGDVLWINPTVPGGLTKIEPSAPNIKVSIALIIHAATNGIIMVRPSLGMRLTDLHDVNAFTPATGDLISFNSTKWESKSLADLGIATVAQLHNAVAINPTDPNGLSIDSNQVLSLGLASASVTGALSGSDWSTFNNKENAITAGTTAQYWRGDKTFQDFATAVRGSLLTGYVVGANTALAATDSVLGAFQKLQGQVNARISGTLTSGRIPFATGTSTLSDDSGLTWDNTSKRLGVGVGLNPNEKISISVDSKYILELGRDSGTDNTTALIRFRNSSNTSVYSAYIGSIRESGLNGRGALVFGTNPETSSVLVDGTIERMRITVGGLVLIGTSTAPSDNPRLFVNGTFRNLARHTITSKVNSDLRFVVNYENSTHTAIYNFNDSTSQFGTLNIGGGITLGSGLVILNSGNVGILTGTPTNTLDVNGTARIRSIANATGSPLTVDAAGVVQQRTRLELITDMAQDISGWSAGTRQRLEHTTAGVLEWVNV